MPFVKVEPSGLVIEVAAGEALAVAAWRQGYIWPTTCWGRAECTVCVTFLLAGAEHAVPAERGERQAIKEHVSKFLQRPNARLACQLKLIADGLVVEKKGVYPPQER